MSASPGVIEPAAFRHALGHFCTGVTVVAAVGADGEPIGFACQSFAALSLDPPLVLFCPGKTSRTWPLIIIVIGLLKLIERMAMPQSSVPPVGGPER